MKNSIYFAVLIIFLMKMNVFAIQEPKYRLIKKSGPFEIRQYEPYIIAETPVEATFEQAGNIAFGRLYDYISGKNRSKKSISMTAPVGQEKASEKIPMTAPVGQTQEDDRYWVSFVMPIGSTLDSLPEPADSRVRLREIPAYTAAVVRYSGMWTEKRYRLYETKLKDFILKEGYRPSAPSWWARYNPPFMPFFLRRNEIIIPIETAHVEESIKSLYDFEVKDIDGNPISMASFKGKILLVVNVASRCGFTKQYAGLETLYQRYKEKGLVVLGFPANNFGGQEPADNPEIKAFCQQTFNVTFPLFSKISVAGDDIHPLYAYLTDNQRNAPFGGAIKWNFTKFLIDQSGKTVGRFASKIDPLDDQIVRAIENLLR